jgi:hypothetical protein
MLLTRTPAKTSLRAIKPILGAALERYGERLRRKVLDARSNLDQYVGKGDSGLKTSGGSVVGTGEYGIGEVLAFRLARKVGGYCLVGPEGITIETGTGSTNVFDPSDSSHRSAARSARQELSGLLSIAAL